MFTIIYRTQDFLMFVFTLHAHLPFVKRLDSKERRNFHFPTAVATFLQGYDLEKTT